MKIVGMIPARYNSTRFPGKALALLDGRPMLCRIVEAARESGVLTQIYVATDSPEIKECCASFGYPVIMTKSGHSNPTSRIKEAAEQAAADLYVMIGGDEPLITPSMIRLVTKEALAINAQNGKKPFVINAMTSSLDAPEVFDPSNIKIVCNEKNEALYASRSPIPFPKGNLGFSYKKFVSIGVYTAEALTFFTSTPPGLLEQTEEFDLLRFMEHGKIVYFIDIKAPALSVDTPKDLERVNALIHSNIL